MEADHTIDHKTDVRQSIADEIADIEASGLRRHRPVLDAPIGRVVNVRAGNGRRALINWSSNDYLAATSRIQVKNAARAALRSWGAGAGSARLLSGGLALHRRFEQRMAHFLGTEDVLLCSTGYQANIAALVALASDSEDTIIVDRLCHASIYDGTRLANGRMLRCAHNDLADLEKKLRLCDVSRRVLVCIESVYSMDGDEAPIVEIAALCEKYNALLYVDEAHAFGIYGNGRGLCAEHKIIPDILSATCSKSLGAQGGFIAASQNIIDLCVNRGRSFIFSTAPVPAAVGAALGMLDVIQKEKNIAAELFTRSQAMRQAITEQGWQTIPGRSPIIPIIVGNEKSALELSEQLRNAGHYAPAIRPPTVAPGQCRIRLSLTLAHKPSDMNRLLKVLAGCKKA